MKSNRLFDAVTVTLNPAIDRTLVIDGFSAGRVNRVQSFRDNAGGKGINVAIALADFNVQVAAAGLLGDENDNVFQELFRQKQIADYFIRVKGATRIGIKISDPIKQQTTDINFPGLSPSRAEVQSLFRSLAKVQAAKPCWFALGGSVPPKTSSRIYFDLIARLKRQGHKVLLDTSGEPLRQAIPAMPNILKPNLHELEELNGRSLNTDRSVVHAARDLIRSGIELVAVSMGERGACFVSEHEVIFTRPPKVKVDSTVGAGDAMAAGIIAGQLRHESLETCARLATAFSLEAITQLERGIRSRSNLNLWMQRVKIERQLSLGFAG